MRISLLLFDGTVERASFDHKKIKELADEGNGFDENGVLLIGPYMNISIEVEDFDCIRMSELI